MKPFGILLATGVASLALAACDGDVANTAPAQADTTAATGPEAEPQASAPSAGQAQPASANAPNFAVLYPDSTLSQPVVTANGADGPGGMAEFTTGATPDEVIAFYRDIAAAAGLKPVMSMNQGDARAFAALNTNGAEVQVVASLNAEGATSAQLTWKAGH